MSTWEGFDKALNRPGTRRATGNDDAKEDIVTMGTVVCDDPDTDDVSVDLFERKNLLAL